MSGNLRRELPPPPPTAGLAMVSAESLHESGQDSHSRSHVETSLRSSGIVVDIFTSVPFHPCAVLAILASGGGGGPIHSTYFSSSSSSSSSSIPCSTTTTFFSSFPSCSSGPKFASSAILLPGAMRWGPSFRCGRGGREGEKER